MKRRDFVKSLPLGIAAFGVPSLFGSTRVEAFGHSAALSALTNESVPSDRILVVINLAGGNDGLNTIIPFGDSIYQNNRTHNGFITPADRTTLQKYLIRPDLAMNPNIDAPSAYTKLMKMWSDKKLAIVQNVGYPIPNRSHFRSTDIWNTASDSDVVLSTGWLGRYIEHDNPNYPFGVNPGDDPLALSIGHSLGLAFQGSKSEMAVAAEDPSHYAASQWYVDDTPAANPTGDQLGFARDVLKQSDVYKDSFNKVLPSAKNNVIYPSTNSLAQQLQKVVWCINAGMKTRIYFVQQPGYDTHVEQNSKDPASGQGKLLFELSEAIALFQEDIEKFGFADRVVGMTYSEFGRRVVDNASNGTDHGTCAPQFVFGAGINGELYGTHPDLTKLDANGDLIWQIDFRQYYAAVLGDWFGVSTTLRKAVLNGSTAVDLGTHFSIDGSTKSQSLFSKPASVSTHGASANCILAQNYPNPFHSSTMISFQLAASNNVKLEVFDSRGALITTLIEARLGRGEHTARFDATHLASGTYYYRLQSGEEVFTRVMTFAR
ncbi:MAG: DUF1501 domain-containing protein [Candidatus Kapaibacterium sp.]|jgi:uncharacterized protein (DUF1501 family)